MEGGSGEEEEGRAVHGRRRLGGEEGDGEEEGGRCRERRESEEEASPRER